MTKSTQVMAQPGQSSETPPLQWTLLPVLFGVILLAFAAIFTRLAEAELSVSATVFNRYFLATIALGFWQLVANRLHPEPVPAPEIDAIDKSLFLLSSILGTLAVSLWAISLTQTSVANSNLLHNLTPIFAVLGGWLFLGQHFDGKYLVGMLLAIAGVVMISLADLQEARGSLRGDVIALISAVFYAFNYLTREKLRAKFSTIQILFWTCLLSSVYTGLAVLTTHVQVFPHSWQTWVAVVGLAVVCQVLGQGLLIQNLKRFSASFITLLMLLEPLITASLAAVIFAERLSGLNWLAFAIVLAGIYLARMSIGTSSAIETDRLDLSEAP
jgi:drug/metabolite transporter (DMT)-like permease